jgi:hypothetical protein
MNTALGSAVKLRYFMYAFLLYLPGAGSTASCPHACDSWATRSRTCTARSTATSRDSPCTVVVLLLQVSLPCNYLLVLWKGAQRYVPIMSGGFGGRCTSRCVSQCLRTLPLAYTHLFGLLSASR